MYTYILVLVNLIIWALPATAGENKAYVKDGAIVIETKDGTRTVDYSGRDGTSRRGASLWHMREEISPVDKALNVFKDKSKTYYNKRVWFIDEGNGIEQFYVDFTTDDPHSSPYLLPYANFAYYTGYSLDGILGVYGINLADPEDLFFVDHSSHFNLVSCGQKESYLVVQQDGALKQLVVYEPTGNKTATTFPFGSTIDEIQQSLCP